MSSPVFELAVSDTGFVFDPRTGATFSVNDTGLVVLNALRSRTDAGRIAETLRQRFDATPAEVGEHVEDFLRALRQVGISVPGPGGGGVPSSNHGGDR